ncbi:OPT oligopeptide transporter domain-containing protein [Trichoderma novae-zelandiae]
MTSPSPQGRSFTVRGVAAGLGVGTVICAANMYFGLQTGWVSIMSMPSSLMGFAVFKLLKPYLRFPFSPVENVLVQSVAGGMAIMPLGCGFVGVVGGIPAMNYLLGADEQGPLSLSTWQLIIWSLGLCYFGVVFAVPLRHQVIIRERLRFPSGFSTAVLIRVLHSQGQGSSPQELDAAAKGGFASLVPRDEDPLLVDEGASVADDEDATVSKDLDWAYNMRLLLVSFLVSGIFTICNYFLPILRDLPIFGTVAASTWLWTLNPSLAYVGQGIIMGTETTLHMTLGAIVGWGILSPLAKMKGWAPGPVDDWERGSKGWIVWVSLAIMLVDAVVSLAYIAFRPIFETHVATIVSELQRRVRHSRIAALFGSSHRYSPISAEEEEDEDEEEDDNQSSTLRDDQTSSAEEENAGLDDAPVEQQVSSRVVSWGLLASVLVCVLSTRIVFGDLVPLYAIVIAVLMALVLSIMGVRALGETDLNPVSGISKLAQLFFALIIPQSHKSSVLINLVAGAISEAGALQAGDLMQDLKTGHLLGAAPKAQFWGQIIGATFGAVFSAFAYHIYTAVYEIPGKLFQVPTAYVWIFTARLVTGQGLPYMAKEWATGAGALFAVTTLARTLSVGRPWRSWIPGGIAVAVGMYNVPSFTLARAIGGVISWYWLSIRKQSTTPLIIIASGFILGEGFLSIVNLWLQALKVPHY